MHPHHTSNGGDAHGNADVEQEWGGFPVINSYESTPPADYSDQDPEDDLSSTSELSMASSSYSSGGAGDEPTVGGSANTGHETQTAKRRLTKQEKAKAKHHAELTWTKAKTLAAYGVYLKWETKLDELENKRAVRKKANKKHYEALKAKIASQYPKAITALKKEMERQRTYIQDVDRKAAESNKEARMRYEKQKQREREARESKKAARLDRNALYRTKMVRMAAQCDESAQAWLEKDKQRDEAGYWKRKAAKELYPWEDGYVGRTVSSPQSRANMSRSAPASAASHLPQPQRPHWPIDRRSVTGIHDRREGPVDRKGTWRRKQLVDRVQIDQSSDWETTDGETIGSASSPFSPHCQGRKGRCIVA